MGAWSFEEYAMRDFIEHALSSHPNECCGLVINGEYHPCENKADDPKAFFKISAEERAALEIKYGKPEAICHSHIIGHTTDQVYQWHWPSKADMQSWIKEGIPFWIVATDGAGTTEILKLDDANRPPLEDRDFHHGWSDCYALVRDFYHSELGIDLMNCARSWDWWNHGDDLYEDNFAAAGFIEIDRNQAMRGDVILYRFAGPTTHHAGVFVGNDLVFHHYIGRKPSYHPRSRLARSETKTLRYVGTK